MARGGLLREVGLPTALAEKSLSNHRLPSPALAEITHVNATVYGNHSIPEIKTQ